MKLFLSQISQNEAVSVTELRIVLFLVYLSLEEAVSVLLLTGCICFCCEAHRIKLFLSYGSQNEAFSIHTSHRMKLFLSCVSE